MFRSTPKARQDLPGNKVYMKTNIAFAPRVPEFIRALTDRPFHRKFIGRPVLLQHEGLGSMGGRWHTPSGAFHNIYNRYEIVPMETHDEFVTHRMPDLLLMGQDDFLHSDQSQHHFYHGYLLHDGGLILAINQTKLLRGLKVIYD